MLGYAARLLADRGDTPGGFYLFLDEPLAPRVEKSSIFCTDSFQLTSDTSYQAFSLHSN